MPLTYLASYRLGVDSSGRSCRHARRFFSVTMAQVGGPRLLVPRNRRFVSKLVAYEELAGCMTFLCRPDIKLAH